MESWGKEGADREEEKEKDYSFYKLEDLGRLGPLCLFKQLFAHFTVSVETYAHPSALAAAITKARAAQQPFAPVDTMWDEIKKKYKNTAPPSQGAPNLLNEVSYISCAHISFVHHWLHIS